MITIPQELLTSRIPYLMIYNLRRVLNKARSLIPVIEEASR